MSKGKTPRSSSEIAAMVKKGLTKCYQIQVTNFNGNTVWLGQPTLIDGVWYCQPVAYQSSAATFCEYDNGSKSGWVFLACLDQFLSFTSSTFYGDFYLDFSSHASAVWVSYDNAGRMLLSAQGSTKVGYLCYYEDGSDGYFFCEDGGESNYTQCQIALVSTNR